MSSSCTIQSILASTSAATARRLYSVGISTNSIKNHSYNHVRNVTHIHKEITGTSSPLLLQYPKRYRCISHPKIPIRTKSSSSTTTTTTTTTTNTRTTSEEAQRRAYAHYQRNSSSTSHTTINDNHIRVASYALAAVIGALGATYASVPLYKMFCQATGFGGTTQRVTLSDWASQRDRMEDSNRSKLSQSMYDKLVKASNLTQDVLPSFASTQNQTKHGRSGKTAKTWTDEEAAERLASLRPVHNGRLLTVRFDSTVSDVMPWSFVPTQLDVKVVPGETALSFFTATNHSDKAITGVATYNVHPPRAGLYFNKIQCFCFEEQRLLPGETVDMPVFFFVDPEYAEDPQLARVNNLTLSYTFFQTDEDDDNDNDDDDDDEDPIHEEEDDKRAA
mmetsp:Transcript_21293/g.29863  ORF Transcript_21293/g.29863 Transcript_21293/m.29863 type:complete len:391 (+) Transcript_21293:168-1340(+)|eukprot:CAMPEP_0184864082 /NCGR_PEP_ID=MMETSP0580-20130426/13678_1 /TAXON_ID=1118495 /ORGANISM="Dactyliosolen fragilissimus" /LENGTH=390 /DNA_ID=CAMNT_0027362725 /DNA_START=110 /DNA_END=1282 /DNA_ORIENTATION=+